MAVDRAFCRGFEGWSTTGYVPLDRRGVPFEKSGVTIGSGVDLGALCHRDLDRLGLSTPLTAQLHPYLGLNGVAAMAVLGARPLVLADADAWALTEAVEAHILAILKTLYDAAVKPGARGWRDLTDAEQTVIASLASQYGPRLYEACPRFWTHATAQDWPAVIAELRAFGDDYATRRRAEADYLERALQKPR